MKKNFLFGVLAIFLAGFWFGGASLAQEVGGGSSGGGGGGGGGGPSYTTTTSISTLADWNYVYDENSYNETYNNTNSALRKYEDYYRRENLYSEASDRRAEITDMRCSFNSYADEEGTNQYATGIIKAIKEGNYIEVEVVENSIDGFDSMHFYLSGDALNINGIKNGSNDLYELYTGSDLSVSADIWVKINSCEYPGFSKSWKAREPKWAAINLPIPFTGTISVQYSGGDIQYPRGSGLRLFSAGFAIKNVAGYPGFTPENFTVRLIKPHYIISFDANGGEPTSIENQGKLVGEKVIEPEVIRTGYILQGWFDGDEKFDFSTALEDIDVIEKLIALTAEWEAMTSTGGAKMYSGDELTGMVVEADAPEIPTTSATSVQATDSTATVLGEVNLEVYTDSDGNGSGDAKITTKVNFDKPISVKIPVSGDATSVKVKVMHNTESAFGIEGLTTNSGATCSGGVATPAYDGSAIPVTSGYVEIWTCSASKFVAYTETQNSTTTTTTTTSSSGGGGGGSSSYSCKNLPDNAVANNTTKPKKNTNYSYSTDTDAVCSFQCKTGYVRNEKDAKCEKGDDETKTEETESDDNSVTNDASTPDSQKVLEDGYTQEFHDAYDFAFKNGITTMPSIQEADMNSPLTRIAMAKMLSQYAINVLGKTPDTGKTISFPDVSAELDAQYNNGVTLAYQLGIMGINIENFRPNDLVTRAEFGTALSRLLYGTADGEGAYYETHLQKLMDEKIITNDNPDLQELRGYVMIMLMRSANK